MSKPIIRLKNAEVVHISDRYDETAKGSLQYERMTDFFVCTTNWAFHATFSPDQKGFTLCDAVRILAGDHSSELEEAFIFSLKQQCEKFANCSGARAWRENK